MNPHLPRWKSATTLFARVAASFCIVLGALVIIGWYSHTIRLVQPWSSFAPVQFNTALGFLFSGSALLALTFKRDRTASVFGALVAMLGVLTGIEYVLAVNLGIDEFFIKHYITVETSSPGRMAPNVAMGFLLCGFALLLSAFFKGSVGLFSQSSLAALTAALGFSALLGYVIGLEGAYGWGHYTQMSIPAGVGFVCIGLGIMSYSISTLHKSFIYQLAVPAGLAIVVSTLTFWQALISYESDFVREQVTLANHHAVKLLDQKILLAAAALERNVTRWKYIDGTPRDQWTKDVEQYYKDISLFQSVQWVDASFHSRWIVPLPGNESLVDFLYTEESLGRDAMLRARDSGHYATTGVLDLAQGGKGFMVCFPIGQGDTFDGFIVATARVQEFFDHQLQDFQKDNYILVKENGNIIYQSHQGTIFAILGERRPSFPLQVFGNKWSLQLFPIRGSSDTGYTVMTSFMLCGGLIIAMGTVWLIRGSARIVEANALLAASEMYQRHIVTALPSGLITTDRNEIIQEANDEAGRQFGYKPENLVGLPAGALLPARYRAGISEVWASVCASPNVIRRGLGENLRGLRQDGSEFPMEVALTPIHRQDELLILVSVIDQTAREEAQNALRYSEEQLQRIIDNSTAVIYMKAVNGQYLLINKRFEELFHKTTEDVVGKTDSDLWPPEFAEAFSANDRWVAETGEILEKEEVAPHDDGPHTYLSVKFPIRDKDGIVYGVAGISQDITERKHAEDALFIASERVLLATRAAQMGIWDYDALNNRLVWDDKMYAIYGVAEKDFLGAYEAWEAGLHPEDRARAVEALQEALRSGEPFDSEFRVVWPDGTVRDVEAHAVVLRNGSGDPFRMIGTNCDITERKRAEEAGRRQTKELQALNRKLTSVNEELNQFAYVASHDLQEPLRTITTYCGFLREDIGENLTDDAREDLEILVSSTGRMRRLVQDLLHFSRSSKKELEKTPCPLKECVEGALCNLQELVNERHAVIVLGALPTLSADKGLITQVFQNIVGNAIKFQKTEPPRVEISAAYTQEKWTISIADHGIGIDPQYAEQIFAPFKRLHSAHDYEGSGIGLAVARKIIERHGGEIWVEQNKGQGSVFKFTLA